MLNAASTPKEPRTSTGSAKVGCALPEVRRHPVRHPDDYGIALPEWLRECIANVPPGIGQSCPTDAEALLVSAFDFGFQLHEGQFRASGDPYIVHPVAVADLLRDIGASAPVIAAGFLHDVVEDTDVTPDQIELHFGSEVRELVEGVTKLGGIHFNDRTEAQAENLRGCSWRWPATSVWCW
jgi:(p)ppGpp synthase/HD superfamily hydrolase